MNSPHAIELTRRSLLASVGGIAGAALVHQAAADEKEVGDTEPRPHNISEVRKEFERLVPLWQEERKECILSSQTLDYWKGPHGKSIIALGPAIIPYLIQHVKTGDFWFNVPLAMLTKVDIANGEYVSEQAKSKLWVSWWEAGSNAPSQ